MRARACVEMSGGAHSLYFLDFFLQIFVLCLVFGVLGAGSDAGCIWPGLLSARRSGIRMKMRRSGIVGGRAGGGMTGHDGGEKGGCDRRI